MADHWFGADHHFGHGNIIEYSGRPFATAEEMDEAMIDAWNGVVAPKDEVWYLGDLELGHTRDETRAILRRLNGRIHLLFGNHDDRNVSRWAGEFREIGLLASTHSGFEEIKIGGQPIVLCHYAMETWNRSHHGAWMLHGHSHGRLRGSLDKRRFDVGVDSVAVHLAQERLKPYVATRADLELRPADYRPISFTEVTEIMQSRQFWIDAKARHG